MLDLSKVEAGEIRMSPEPVSVTQAMHTSMSMIETARQLLGVHFVDSLPTTDPAGSWRTRNDCNRSSSIC